MNPRIQSIKPPANPVLQFLYFLFGAVVLVGALLVGAVILSIAFGLAFIDGLVVWARIWWLRRKLERRAGRDRDARGPETRRRPARHATEIIDVEYTVVEERDDRPRD